MKKFILGILLLGFVSCQITERMYLSESGMVSQQTEVDFSTMMGFAFSPEKIDSMKLAGEFPIDTIVPLASTGLTPGSEDNASEAEKQFTKSFDKTKVRIVMNEEGGKFIMMADEMSLADFNDYQKNIQTALKEFEAKDPKSAAGFQQSGYSSVLQYKYSEKDFERISLNKQVKLDEEETDSSGLSMRDMIGMYTYKMEYHFPKAVKSTTLKDAVISKDGKTVTAEIQMDDLLENPENYNFKVEFK